MRERDLERHVAEHPSATSVELYDTSDPARGTLSLYREPWSPEHPPHAWFASVVWRPTADRPQETVDGPHEGWPGPTEFDAAVAEATAACWLIAARHTHDH